MSLFLSLMCLDGLSLLVFVTNDFTFFDVYLSHVSKFSLVFTLVSILQDFFNLPTGLLAISSPHHLRLLFGLPTSLVMSSSMYPQVFTLPSPTVSNGLMHVIKLRCTSTGPESCCGGEEQTGS